jgi:hypothetical protein
VGLESKINKIYNANSITGQIHMNISINVEIDFDKIQVFRDAHLHQTKKVNATD